MPKRFARQATPALAAVVARVIPGATLLDARPFGVDESTEADDATAKGLGYGVPLRLTVRERDGAERILVFHTAKSDQFGHDRRADRAAEMLLGFDRMASVPGQVRALDVGAIKKDGTGLISLAEVGEFYLLTEFAPGHLYADELRQIAHRGDASAQDIAHCEALARHLVGIHSEKYRDGERYRRAVRDLIGSGEGLFGLVDAYDPDVPAAPPERIDGIERRAVAWRRKLKQKTHRLSRTHGDFHPFNVVFSERDEIALLDASRGSMGDAADDVTALAINYVFFAVEHPGTWQSAFRALWKRFFEVYVDESGDPELFDVVAPFLAWRGLVVSNPVWYPHVDADARDRVLGLLERALDAERFDPNTADEVFA